MEMTVVQLWIQEFQVDFGVSFCYYNNVKYFTQNSKQNLRYDCRLSSLGVANPPSNVMASTLYFQISPEMLSTLSFVQFHGILLIQERKYNLICQQRLSRIESCLDSIIGCGRSLIKSFSYCCLLLNSWGYLLLGAKVFKHSEGCQIRLPRCVVRKIQVRASQLQRNLFPCVFVERNPATYRQLPFIALY